MSVQGNPNFNLIVMHKTAYADAARTAQRQRSEAGIITTDFNHELKAYNASVEAGKTAEAQRRQARLQQLTGKYTGSAKRHNRAAGEANTHADWIARNASGEARGFPRVGLLAEEGIYNKSPKGFTATDDLWQ